MRKLSIPLAVIGAALASTPLLAADRKSVV